MQTKFYTIKDNARIDVSALMTRNPLIEKLLAIKGARVLTFTTETVPKMNKTGNPYFDKVTKFSRVNGMINFDYVKAFEKRTGETHAPTRASSYLPVFMDDGTGERKTPFQVNAKTQENVFIQLMSLNTKSFYAMDGKELNKALLEPFMPAYGENPVNVRSYGVDGLLELTVDGQEYNPLQDENERLRTILETGLQAIRARILQPA